MRWQTTRRIAAAVNAQLRKRGSGGAEPLRRGWRFCVVDTGTRDTESMDLPEHRRQHIPSPQRLMKPSLGHSNGTSVDGGHASCWCELT